MTTTPVAAALPPQLVEIETPTDDQRDTASSEIRIRDVSYIDTETSRKVMSGIEFARSEPSVVVISGAPGVGKSKAAARYCADRKPVYWGGDRSGGSAVYLQAAPWLSTPTAVFEAIAEQVGGYPHAFRMGALAKFLLSHLGPGDVICIDESQHLDARTIDGLRYFLDQGGIGIAYIGNETLVSRIFGRSKRAVYAQIVSRVGLRISIPGPSEPDIDAMLDAWGVTGRAERAFARELGCMPGGLRTVSQVLRQATEAIGSLPQASLVQRMRVATRILGFN